MSAAAGRRIPVVPVVAFLGSGEVVYYGTAGGRVCVTTYRDLGRASMPTAVGSAKPTIEKLLILAARVDSATIGQYLDMSDRAVVTPWKLNGLQDWLTAIASSGNRPLAMRHRRAGYRVRKGRPPWHTSSSRCPTCMGRIISPGGFLGSLDLWSYAVSVANEPCLLVDVAGVVVAASPGCGQLFDIDARDAVGRRLVDGVLRLLDFNVVSGELPGWEVDKKNNPSPPCSPVIRSRRRTGGVLLRRGFAAAGRSRYPDERAPPVPVDAIYRPFSPLPADWPDGSWSARSTGSVLARACGPSQTP